MTPRVFFLTFVKPNYDDFSENSDSLRHAFNAAVAASHMADHWYKFCKKQRLSDEFPKLCDLVTFAITETDGAFKLVRNIADAYKHLYISQYEPALESTGSVTAFQIERDESQIDEIASEEDDGAGCVLCTTKDDQEHEVLPLVRTVVEFWDDFLRTRGC